MTLTVAPVTAMRPLEITAAQAKNRTSPRDGERRHHGGEVGRVGAGGAVTVIASTVEEVATEASVRSGVTFVQGSAVDRAPWATITTVFTSKGIRRRVLAAVEQVLQPGEDVRETVYLHVYGSPLPAMASGLPVNINTWIVAVTDRRFLVFKGDEFNASRSVLVSDYPRSAVTVTASGRNGKATRLAVVFGADGQRQFSVPNIWRRDARALIAEMAD